ncbi:MAG: TlyA family RNA methyltransferase [Actinomycetaceae bacterium]|nr:TlyA family RNA methyltransferase [Actinomycetaceae bacterium]
MGRLRRLDSELVRRKLAPSRTRAQELIGARRVYVDGQVATKASRQLDPAQAIEVKDGQAPDYVSRGGHKLAGALDYMGNRAPRVAGTCCLDAGASTGGFTDVLLRRGCEKVYAVDVGYGQLAWSLATDPRVDQRDRTNVRTLKPEDFSPAPELIVSDLSFISLTLVLPALHDVAAPVADFVLMVKPQFEAGKDRVGPGGVVRDTAIHVETVTRVIDAAQELGLALAHVAPSPLPGPAGNVEYFVHLVKGRDVELNVTVGELVERAVADGPAGAKP